MVVQPDLRPICPAFLQFLKRGDRQSTRFAPEFLISLASVATVLLLY
jgi:hypothetical protein